MGQPVSIERLNLAVNGGEPVRFIFLARKRSPATGEVVLISTAHSFLMRLAMVPQRALKLFYAYRLLLQSPVMRCGDNRDNAFLDR